MAEQILLSPLMDEETGTLRSQASGARSQGWGGAKWALRETRPVHPLSQRSLGYNSLQHHQDHLLSLLMKNKDQQRASFFPGHSESLVWTLTQGLAFRGVGFFRKHSMGLL